jgi:nitrous oxidase accessory protein NosD
LGVVAILLVLFFGGLAGATSPIPTRGHFPNVVTTTLTIRADGSVSTAGILSVSGNTYTLMAAYAGSIADERNGSVLDGAGNTLTYTSGTATVVVYAAVNVTVQGLDIVSTQVGIEVLNSSVVTVTNNTIATTAAAIEVLTSTTVTVSNNTAPSTAGFGISDSSGLLVQDNNGANSTVDGLDGFSSAGVTVRGNDFSHAKGVPLNMAYVTSLYVEGNRLDSSIFGFGINLDFVDHANVSSNIVTGELTPVQVGSSANISLWENVVSPSSMYPYNIETSNDVLIADAVGLQSTGAGALLMQDVGVTLLRVDFSNSANGIDDEASTGVRVLDSHLGGGGNGVLCFECWDLSIVGSDLSVSNNGLFAQLSSGILVQNSNLSRANYPINLTSGTRNVLVEGSQLDGAQIGGVYLNNVSNITLNHSSIRSAAQYAVYSTATSGLTLSSSDLSGTPARPGVLGVSTFKDTSVALVNDSLNWRSEERRVGKEC